MSTNFTTNPIALSQLLQAAHQGQLQLPDFQRSWVWDDGRIKSLIASVSCGFPVGALMTLKTQAEGANKFAHRLVQGAPDENKKKHPSELLLDGQQRITSLYQTCMRNQIVTTINGQKNVVKRWFYIDIQKALSPGIEREDAVIAVPEDRRLKSNFDKKIDLDLSSPELEYKQLMFPLNCVFNLDSWDLWQDKFVEYCFANDCHENRHIFTKFKNEVVKNIQNYQIPVISLASDTSHEAVCLVFEKVNTGGKALDAFELLTAMYSADGHKLRDDWLGRSKTNDQEALSGIYQRLSEFGRIGGDATGVLSGVTATDFLQSIALLYAREKRQAAMDDKSIKENDWPAVRATRQSLLDLPLDAYLKYRDKVEAGYKKVGEFLISKHIYRILDLPYQGQLVPMAALFVLMGNQSEHDTHMKKLTRWFWCGVFGELYGSASESRFARDIMEVPQWIAGGEEPGTVKEGLLRPERLLTMRTRLSAAYKGIHALLMSHGAIDFRSGQPFGQAVFFDKAVDIHHIFPKAWCENRKPKLTPAEYDTVVNKTPLSYRTNRIIGGDAPSRYLKKLEDGRQSSDPDNAYPPIAPSVLDGFLFTHAIPVAELRDDDFDAFIQARQQKLLALVAVATGNAMPVATQNTKEEGEEVSETLAHDAGILFPGAG